MGFGEEFAAFTTHGGRTMSPVIDGDLVIVGAPVSNWGAQANRSHRLIALDKRTARINVDIGRSGEDARFLRFPKASSGGYEGELVAETTQR